MLFVCFGARNPKGAIPPWGEVHLAPGRLAAFPGFGLQGRAEDGYLAGVPHRYARRGWGRDGVPRPGSPPCEAAQGRFLRTLEWEGDIRSCGKVLGSITARGRDGSTRGDGGGEGRSHIHKPPLPRPPLFARDNRVILGWIVVCSFSKKVN